MTSFKPSIPRNIKYPIVFFALFINFIFLFDFVCNNVTADFGKLGMFSALSIFNKSSTVSTVKWLRWFTAHFCNFSQQLVSVKPGDC